MAARHEALYHAAAIRTARLGRARHLFKGTGEGYPRSLCGDAQGVPVAKDDPAAVWCRECRLVAVTELALALDSLGFTAEAVAVAGLIHSASFEVRSAMADTA